MHDYISYMLREKVSGLISGEDPLYSNGQRYPPLIAFSTKEKAKAEIEAEGIGDTWEVVKVQLVFPDDDVIPLDYADAWDD